MPTRTSMNVSLSPELAKYVRSCVETGEYLTASEVVRESLRLLRRQQQERRILVSEVRERIEAAYRESLLCEPLDADDVLRSARERVRTGRKPPVADG